MTAGDRLDGSSPTRACHGPPAPQTHAPELEHRRPRGESPTPGVPRFAAGGRREDTHGMDLRHAQGQTTTEYGLVMAGLAVVCLVMLVFLGIGVREYFRSTGEASSSAVTRTPRPLIPPVASSYPETLADCEDGHWRTYPQFQNERECKDYVRDKTS